jgi:Zn-dependent protease with chaperone function
MNLPGLQLLVQVFTEQMLNTAVEGIILAFLVWAWLRLVRRQNSGTRFAICFVALMAIVALPFFAGSGIGTSHFPLFDRASPQEEVILSGNWSFYLFAAWAAGAGLLLLRLGVALWHVHRLRSNCQEVNLTRLDRAIARIFRDFASHYRTKFCVSKQVTAPSAIGFFQPAIVFPAWILPQLSAAEIQVILLHENAHLRRWDHWTNLAQKILAALFFFHPAVWWIDNRLTLEREMACDDMVLAQMANPRDYASFLISFAEKMQSVKGLALAQALVSRMRQISVRVAQILDTKRPSHIAFWKPVLGVSAGMLAVMIGAAPYAPRFVALPNQPGPSQSRQLQAEKKEAPPAAVAATERLSRTLAPPVGRRLALAPRPRALLAAYNPRTAVVPLRSAEKPQPKPVVMRAKAAQKELSGQTFVILQTTEYDSSGSGVWILRIWRVEGGHPAERQLESAIILAT